MSFSCREPWLLLLFAIHIVRLLRHPVMAKIPRVPSAVQTRDKNTETHPKDRKGKAGT